MRRSLRSAVTDQLRPSRALRIASGLGRDEIGIYYAVAMMLRDAGLDFVYVDSTNWPYADNRDKSDSSASVIAPFNELLKVWNTPAGRGLTTVP